MCRSWTAANQGRALQGCREIPAAKNPQRHPISNGPHSHQHGEYIEREQRLPVIPKLAQVDGPAMRQNDLLRLVVVKNREWPQHADGIPELSYDVNEELQQRDEDSQAQ